MLLDEFFILFFLHKYKLARFLLEIVSILPFISCLLIKLLFKFNHSIILVKELIESSASIIFRTYFTSLNPDKPLLLIISLQKLHLIKTSLLIFFIVSDISLLHVASVVIKHMNILNFTSRVYFIGDQRSSTSIRFFSLFDFINESLIFLYLRRNNLFVSFFLVGPFRFSLRIMMISIFIIEGLTLSVIGL